jgi:ubiquinone/menaquinone biosynthesis C-methylase UbiE
MTSRPAHLTKENASRFQDRSVVDAYHLRLPYPPEIFDILTDLVTGTPRTVLDVGTGTGEIARPLADRVDRVDAVDLSGGMIARGKTMPGGDHPHLRWIEGSTETVTLHPPYALITAADSLHWMDWDTVLPRFRDLCSPHGHLAMVFRAELPAPWQDGLARLIAEYSTTQNYQPYDLARELEQRGLFERVGTHETSPVASRQPIDNYIESFHSRSSFSRENMPAGAAAAFARDMRELIDPWVDNGTVTLQTIGTVVWGLPLTGT